MIERSYITHKEIMEGGTLVFEMGEHPNKNTKYEMAPSSKLYN